MMELQRPMEGPWSEPVRRAMPLATTAETREAIEHEPEFLGITATFPSRRTQPCARCDERILPDQYMRLERYRNGKDRGLHNSCLDMGEWTKIISEGRIVRGRQS